MDHPALAGWSVQTNGERPAADLATVRTVFGESKREIERHERAGQLGKIRMTSAAAELSIVLGYPAEGVPGQWWENQLWLIVTQDRRRVVLDLDDATPLMISLATALAAPWAVVDGEVGPPRTDGAGTPNVGWRTLLDVRYGPLPIALPDGVSVAEVREGDLLVSAFDSFPDPVEAAERQAALATSLSRAGVLRPYSELVSRQVSPRRAAGRATHDESYSAYETRGPASDTGLAGANSQAAELPFSKKRAAPPKRVNLEPSLEMGGTAAPRPSKQPAIPFGPTSGGAPVGDKELAAIGEDRPAPVRKDRAKPVTDARPGPVDAQAGHVSDAELRPLRDRAGSEGYTTPAEPVSSATPFQGIVRAPPAQVATRLEPHPAFGATTHAEPKPTKATVPFRKKEQ
ncbi:MAG: hypothetical protein AAGA56_12135, partial [Myxococcota bacterium]